MIHHDWPCDSARKKKHDSPATLEVPHRLRNAGQRGTWARRSFLTAPSFRGHPQRPWLLGWVNGGWWCFVFLDPHKAIWMMVVVDDIFWMVIREVLFLFLFLVCTCSFVLLLRVFTSSESCPPLPSRLLLPLLLLLYIPLLLLLLPLLPSSPST